MNWRFVILSASTAIGILFSSTAMACEKVANPCATAGGNHKFWLIAFALLVAFGAWRHWNAFPAIALDPNDPAVIAAKERARQTLARFWEAHRNPTADMDFFSLKVELPEMDDGIRESLWLSEISEREGRIYGRIDNDPVHPDYKYGQVILVDADRIVDWAYAVDRKVRGHFMTRVMVSKSSKRSARRMKKILGWTDADLISDGA